MQPFIEEGTFTATGLDLLAPVAATSHVAIDYTPPARPSWWRRVVARLRGTDA